MGSLIRAVLVIGVLVLVGVFAFGYWSGRDREDRPAAGSGQAIDPAAVRESGKALADKTAATAGRVNEALTEGALTAKIKAKMALDDAVKASAIDVTTNAGIVTLAGTVGSAAERDRAVRLARETEGVVDVVNKLSVKRR